MSVDGKELKSRCNSCGKNGTHDAIHKAGKALYLNIKKGGVQTTDIQKEDNKQAENDDDDIIDKSKKDKKDKKDKKKKKDGNSDDEAEDVSDLDDDLSWDSRRIGKYHIHKLIFL